MITPEWSHKINVDQLGPAKMHFDIKAGAEDRKDVARRLKLESLPALSAQYVIQRESGTMRIKVKGQLHAELTQLCIITQEPVDDVISEEFDAFFSDRTGAVSFAKAKHERQSKLIDAELQILDEGDDPEPVIDGQIDLGELAVQHLALAINQYPQKAGATSEHILPEPETPQEPKTRNPFAALKEWKVKQGSES